MTTKIAEYIVPEHWLCPLINGDYSGMDEQDIEALDAFMRDGVAHHGQFSCLGTVDDETNGFMRYHDAQPYGIGACDTYRVAFAVDRD